MDKAKANKAAERIHNMVFASVYPLYVQKAERKGRTRKEVDEIISWLTGYDVEGIRYHIGQGSSFKEFFNSAPRINPDAAKITGSICGYKVEEIEDKTVQKVRYLDKLIDELARGKAMEKILRT